MMERHRTEVRVVKPKLGKWVETEERETHIGVDWDANPVKLKKYRLPLCSICGEEFGTVAFNYNFCPNCGARMKGADKDVAAELEEGGDSFD